MKAFSIILSALLFSVSTLAADAGQEDLLLIRTEGDSVPVASYGEDQETAVNNLIHMCERVRHVNSMPQNVLAQIQDVKISVKKYDGTHYIQGSCIILGDSQVVDSKYIAPFASQIIDLGEDGLVSVGTISYTQIKAALQK